MKPSRLVIALCFCFCQSAFAAPFVVKDVEVHGLARIPAGSFFNYLPIKRGDTIDEKDFSKIIKTLYQTNFFDEINLSRQNNTLIIDVNERPIIGEIRINGNKEVKNDMIKKGLTASGLGEGDSFDAAKLNQVTQDLLNIYYAKSKFDVIINLSTKMLSNQRLALIIDIQEGISARIKGFNIVGNRAFSEDTLLSHLKLEPTRWHSLLTGGDQYSGEKLSADLTALESFYLNRGFLDFRIKSTQVMLSEDKKSVFISISVEEGLPYRIADSSFSGSELIPNDQLFEKLTYTVGSYYARDKVRASQTAIKNAFADKGYAFANVQIVPEINKEKHEVALHYAIKPGKKVYVRRIEFTGNYRTNDEVLRREMRQMEGALYHHSQLERSRERIQRLGYVVSVQQKESTIADKPDQVDVTYEITEMPNRSVTAGIGYGSEAGVLFNAGYQTANFLGTGNQLNVDFSTSDVVRSYSIDYTDPYYTIDGISRTFSFYYREENEDEADIGDWTSDNWGAFIRYGFPIDEYESFSLGAGYRGIRIKTGDKVSPEIPAWLKTHGKQFDEYVVDFNWTHDSRDKTIFANSGSLTRFNIELVAPGSTETYYRLGLRNRTYFQLGERFITVLRGDVSYGDGYGDTDGLPFFKNYYAGGLTTVRGFRGNTLGPRWQNDDVRGGSLRVTGGAEVILPWYFGKDEETVRLGAFLDFGNVYDGYDNFKAEDFRYSTGLYLLWRSPVGPLNLSYGVPLNKKDGDKIEHFQFTIGVPF